MNRSLDLQKPVGNHVYDARAADDAVESRPPVRVNVTVKHELWVEPTNERVEGGKPTVGPVVSIAAIQWG